VENTYFNAMNRQSIINLSAIGAGAFMLADTLHEVVGHGGACLLIGQKVTLITSVYFRSRPGSFVTDIGGPVANLVFGLLIFGILKTTKNLSPLIRVFLMFGMADNFFWFAGTLLQSSFSKTGDWVYAIRELHIGTFERPALIIAAIAAYWISIRMIRPFFTNEFVSGRPILYAYFAAIAAAVISGLFSEYGRGRSAFEALLEVISALPLLFIVRKRQGGYNSRASMGFNVTVLVLFIIFCLTLGRGI
jgi:hypothetical protein